MNSYFCLSTPIRALAVLLALGVVAPPVLAQSETPSIDRVEVGLQSAYKLGCWTQVRISISGGAEDIVAQVAVTAIDGDGLAARYDAGEHATVSIPARSETIVTRYVKFGRAQGELLVELWAGSKRLASRKMDASEYAQPLVSTERLIVAVGPSIDVEETVSAHFRNDEHGFAAIQINDGAALPDRWIGYDGADVVIITTSQPAVLASFSEPRMKALLRWAELGGRIVLCVGSRGNEVFADGAPLAPLAPGEFAEVINQRRTSRLESFVGAGQRLQAAVEGPQAGFSFPQTLLKNIRGNIVVAEGFGEQAEPLIVSSTYGFGHVMLLAVDLDQPPFALWSDRRQFLAKLLEQLFEPQQDIRIGGRRGGVVQVGYTDIAGQLRAALEQFDGEGGVPLAPFSLVAALIAGYLVVIGPLDYLFLRRVVRRMQWTWATFPAVVIGFCVLTWVLFVQLKGDRLLVNQVELIDVDAESGLVRGVVWAHLYSPRSDRFNLQLGVQPGGALDGKPEVLLAWQGLPGQGLGGMESASGGRLSAAAYTIQTDAPRTSGGDVSSMPLHCAATKTLLGRWAGRRAGSAEGQLFASVDGLIEGRVVNLLPFELNDCVVYYGNWAYPLDRPLARGQSARVGGQPFDLRWRLTRRRTIARHDKDEKSPAFESASWDMAGFEVPRIMEIMMFYDAAGGEEYTRLSHRYQDYVDLSKHLNAQRAVLVGRAPQALVSKLTRDGQSLADNYHESWTFCRIVFPVERRTRANR